ncbi:hypothetical protein PR048_029739 [Dryococelus australis]|uniref:Uncharacterized protein n=1 Tax=Dryococelus australis TaxID=614101 RepID=A0ABQ9GE89_9NEOP|nr:hypothetical protein PR048_029739 [Dryococelus australis]
MTALNKVRLENIATWNTRGIKNHEWEISDFLQRHNIQIIALTETHPQTGDTFQTPTRYSENANYRLDILDITTYKNINFTYELEVLQQLHSDHLPVLATLDNANTEDSQARQYITRNINCEKQKTNSAQVQKYTKHLTNPAQVQEYTEQLTNIIQNAIESAILLMTIEKG